MRTLPLLAALLISFSSSAAWQLDNSQSALRFVTVKNSLVAETHSFKTLSGTWSDDGVVNVSIDVKSLDTLVPIRNERMLEHLFHATKFPTITATTKLDPNTVASLAIGATTHQKVELSLTLLDQTQTVRVDLNLVKLADNKVLAYTQSPVLVNAANFKLDAGVAKLQEIAKLKAIELVVPTTFSVVFQR